MQTKRVILTIAALLVAGILIVALLGREPAPTTPAEVSTETAIENTTDNTGAENTAEAPDTVTEETSAVAATEPAATEEAAPATTEETAPAATDETALLAKPSALKVDVAKAMEDRVHGNPNAPVEIIEYASMTCPHCAHFTNDVLPQVKKELLDTGKAKIIYRDFPLDRIAVKAAAMARCADHDKYFDLVDVIFKNQQRWITAENQIQALAQLGTLAGMDEDYIQACMNDPALESALLQKMQEGQKQYTIEATPTFIFNNGAEKYNGARDAAEFAKTVNKLSGSK